MLQQTPHPSIAVIGFGRFARALTLTVPELIRAIVVRSEPAMLPPDSTDAPVYQNDAWIDRLGTAIDTIWIATPDAGIGLEAARLAPLRERWDGITAIHSSGATSAGVLAPLAERGARTLVLHPNGAFTGRESISSGLLWTISSSDPADLAFAHNILTRIHPVIVTVADENRALYHAAASVASNYSVTLFAMAVELFERAGIPRNLANRAVAQFMAGSVERSASHASTEVLTGPIARGDEEVVARQVAAIRAMVPELESVFLELAAATRRMLRDGGTEEGEDHGAASGTPAAQSGHDSTA